MRKSKSCFLGARRDWRGAKLLDAPRYSLAWGSKCLARSNKSSNGDKATKKRTGRWHPVPGYRSEGAVANINKQKRLAPINNGERR
jgi:hypothetical protein